MDKVFVGNVETAQGQFGEYTKIGLSKKDLETLTANLNERGFVNLTLSKSKEGKPYMTIYKPKAAQTNNLHSEPAINPLDLPF